MYLHLDESLFWLLFPLIHILNTAACLMQATEVWRLASCCCWLWLWLSPHPSDRLPGRRKHSSRSTGDKGNTVWDLKACLWCTHRPDAVLPAGTVQASGLETETQAQHAQALRIVPFISEIKNLNLEILKHRYERRSPWLRPKGIAWIMHFYFRKGILLQTTGSFCFEWKMCAILRKPWLNFTSPLLTEWQPGSVHGVLLSAVVKLGRARSTIWPTSCTK